ncbi:hypothetical protein J6590_015587 [Homalodisca vitripennis]|nr:hypothetical protein J6590_015587 [Homalodisca vitripennis]
MVCIYWGYRGERHQDLDEKVFLNPEMILSETEVGQFGFLLQPRPCMYQSIRWGSHGVGWPGHRPLVTSPEASSLAPVCHFRPHRMHTRAPAIYDHARLKIQTALVASRTWILRLSMQLSSHNINKRQWLTLGFRIVQLTKESSSSQGLDTKESSSSQGLDS